MRFFTIGLALLLLTSNAALATNAGISHPRCPRGSHWVPPHRDKNGRWVQGHCRKA